jgi:hypothetical protein
VLFECLFWRLNLHYPFDKLVGDLYFRSSIPEIGPWRFEYKYLLPFPKVYQVRNAILPYVELDPFSADTENGKYLVRSLYFDTRYLNFYQEKIDGDNDRIKFRIRTYSQTLDENTVLKAEIKVRKGVLMEKYSTFIQHEDYLEFMQSHQWESEDPVLLEFTRYFWMKGLQPQILVEYYREGFRTKDKSEIRITFDHQVSSTASTTLFSPRAIFREHHKHVIILEIKCRKGQPWWLLDIVKKHGLKIASSSKYVKGIEISNPGIVTPGWSC